MLKLGTKSYADQIFEKPFQLSELDKSVSKLLTGRDALTNNAFIYGQNENIEYNP